MGLLNVEFITNIFFSSRTYIISKYGIDQVWLVDCGDIEKVMERIGEKTIKGVLLTHTHSDHIYGLSKLLGIFPSVKIFTNQYGVEALKSPKLNFSRYHTEQEDISIDASNNIQVLADEDEINILDVPTKIYETTGHDPSCLTYIIDDMVFTGDSYIPGVKVFAGFPKSNRKQAEQSVEKILKLAAGLTIMPGHSIYFNNNICQY